MAEEKIDDADPAVTGGADHLDFDLLIDRERFEVSGAFMPEVTFFSDASVSPETHPHKATARTIFKFNRDSLNCR